MSRSVFLSAGGDVFLADFVLSLWKNRWYDEIDTMYVGYNNNAQVPLETAYEFVRKWECDPKVRIIYTPHGVGNGTPIAQMLLNSKEEHLMLLEDDGFIFTPGIVDDWFNKVEQDTIDVVGSLRYSVGEVAESAKQKYNLDYSGEGDKGFGWWPNFFLCSRDLLLKTDLDFGSKKYPAGKYFKELDYTFINDDYTDTFTWASIQLRYLGTQFYGGVGLRSYDIPQNHAHPYDLENMRNQGVMFAKGNPQYIHGGSLSSGWGGYLNTVLPPVSTDMEKQDIETRVAMWGICCEETQGYMGFKFEYSHKLNYLIDDCNLDRDRINKKEQLYRNLMHI
ncbi:MAG: hypothetical protein C5B43_04170 [Verrucomicrobia bacterium]|nr:MAG: hypothetical protein C5B43_04170 [Verrucomicrobiota bacterium]